MRNGKSNKTATAMSWRWRLRRFRKPLAPNVLAIGMTGRYSDLQPTRALRATVSPAHHV